MGIVKSPARVGALRQRVAAPCPVQISPLAVSGIRATEETSKVTDTALSTGISPAAAPQRRALFLGVAAGLVWPLQAWLIASVVAALVEGRTPWPALWIAVPGVALAGLMGELARVLAQRAVQADAETQGLELRRALINHELRRAPGGAREDAAVAASLIAERLDLITLARQRLPLAMWRARILPVVIFALVLTQSWLAALVLIATAPLIPLFQALVGWAAQDASARHLVEAGALNAALIDRLAALEDIRLLGATSRAEAQLQTRSHNLAARAMKVLRIAFLSSTVLELFSMLGIALIAVLTGFTLLGVITFGGWHGGLTPFAGIWILLLTPDFYQPLRDLAQVWHDRASGAAAEGELQGRDGGPDILGTGSPATPLPSGALRWSGLVTEQAGALPDGACAPGALVVLQGSSGAGKSTLLALLAGLTRPEAGEVWLGETRLSDETADALRMQIGWVPQLPRFSAPRLEALFGPEAREDEIMQMLTDLGLGPLIAQLPGGLAAPIGEVGEGVSGGEARRILLARALMARPAILLADEPTSDLDEATGAGVIAALKALADAGSGLVVASHDARLIAAADRVIRVGPDGVGQGGDAEAVS